MLYSLEFSLDRYDVSLRSGFLPEVPPLQTLGDSYYSPWEATVRDLPTHLSSRTIRHAVDTLPVLSTSKLRTEREWRRAYVLLAYLTHAYVWGGDRPREVLPPPISSPFLEISSHLELPPCATYAALNLWNFAVPSANADLTCPDDLSVTASFTGTKDEEWFFMISVAIEARGAQLIRLMLDAIYAANLDDKNQVAGCLSQLNDGLQEVGQILERIYEKCSPAVFFHELRPLLAGSRNMASAGLPNGLFYDLGEGKGEWRHYSGGSNAQSSLIQIFDIFLGVEHSATGNTKLDTKPQVTTKGGYLQDMRNYMPGPHRRFLEMLSRISNVRPYVMSCNPNSAVRDAYNSTIMSLGSFRDKHIQIVTRYIILPAKNSRSSNAAARVNIATITSTQVKNSDTEIGSGLSGTGGTDLIPFLKQTRDTTKAAANYGD